MATSSKRISAEMASADIRKWLEDEDDGSEVSDLSADERCPDGSSSDADDAVDVEIERESEFSCSDSDEVEQPNTDDYISKDKRVKWSKNPFTAAQGRRSKANIVQAKRDIVL